MLNSALLQKLLFEGIFDQFRTGSKAQFVHDLGPILAR